MHTENSVMPYESTSAFSRKAACKRVYEACFEWQD